MNQDKARKEVSRHINRFVRKTIIKFVVEIQSGKTSHLATIGELQDNLVVFMKQVYEQGRKDADIDTTKSVTNFLDYLKSFSPQEVK